MCEGPKKVPVRMEELQASSSGYYWPIRQFIVLKTLLFLYKSLKKQIKYFIEVLVIVKNYFDE